MHKLSLQNSAKLEDFPIRDFNKKNPKNTFNSYKKTWLNLDDVNLCKSTKTAASQMILVA